MGERARRSLRWIRLAIVSYCFANFEKLQGGGMGMIDDDCS